MTILDFSRAAKARDDLKYYEALFDVISERMDIAMQHYTTAESMGNRKGCFEAFAQMFVYHGCLFELYPLQAADKPLNTAARIVFMETDTLSAVMDMRKTISPFALAQTKLNAHGSAQAAWSDILDYANTRMNDEDRLAEFFPDDYADMRGAVQRQLSITIAQLAYLTPQYIDTIKNPTFDPAIFIQSDLPADLPGPGNLGDYEEPRLKPV